MNRSCSLIQGWLASFGDAMGTTFVGDPVCVVSGAATDAEIDFRLPEARVPLTWWRTYSSARSNSAGELGYGFRHSFEVDLRFDLDGIRYTDAHGRVIAFPRMERDGEFAVRQATTLTRLQHDRYRVLGAKGNGFVFEFGRTPEAIGRIAAWTERSGQELAALHEPTSGRLTGFEIDGVYRLEILYHPAEAFGGRKPTRLAQVHLVAFKTSTRHVLTTYSYDSLGRLDAVQDGYRQVIRYAYDKANRVIRKIDRLGYAFHYEYNRDGYCVATRGQDGLEDLRLDYRLLEQTTVVQRADGATRTFNYNAQAQVVQRIDPDGGATIFPVDEFGRLAGEIDPLGNVTSYVYDNRGSLTSTIDPLGYRRRYPADPSPHPLSHRQAATPLEWDLGNWCPTPTLRLSASELVTTLPGVVQRGFFLDAAQGGESKEVFDFQGLLIREDDTAGRHRRFGYDPNGNPRWRQDFDGQIERFAYGSWNHLEARSDALSRVTRYEYGANDQVTALVDPGGTRSEYGYDLCDRLALVRRHGKDRERYAYDPAGNLIAIHDAEGRPRVQREIARGNLIKRRVLATGEFYDYTHDERGRLLSIEGSHDRCNFSYAAHGQRKEDRRNGVGIVHRYQDDRIVSSTVFDRFRITYAYSEDHGSLRITDPSGAIIELTRHPGGVVERRDGCGVSEWTQYDFANRVCLRSTFTPETRLKPWQRRFHYSGEGDLILREDSQRGSRRYAVDAAHRLSAQQFPDARSSKFVYDIANNLVHAPGLDASYGPGNRLQSANDERFEHDVRDHISVRHSAAGATRYFYDAKDRLVSIQRPGFEYRALFDGLGRRTHKIVNGKTTAFYWDSDRLAAERSPTGELRIYVYADPFSRVPLTWLDYASSDAAPEGGHRFMVLANHLGCPEEILDARGTTVWRAEIAAYGWASVEIGEAFHQPLRWPGHYFDAETGLHENRFRAYDPRLGRYLQSDPIGLSGGINLYAYTDNPLREVDLDGHTKPPCPDNVLDCPHRHEDGGDGEAPPRQHPPGDESPPPLPRDPSLPTPETAARMQTARQKSQEAQALAQSLPRSLRSKTTAVNGGNHLSGYDTPSSGTRTGFESAGRDPRTNLAYEQQIGHQSAANASVDPRVNSVGHVVGAMGEGTTLPGGAAATHAERQSVIAQNANGTNDPIGVSREQCGDCRGEFRQHAQNESRPGYPSPVVVADPAHTRVYNADGSVDVYRNNADGTQSYVTTAPAGQPPEATIGNYEGIPW
jgi:RHS repeat-associated protein